MLYVVATPIGEMNETSLRAVEVLKQCAVIICESTKETSKFLRSQGITGKQFEILDEHTKPEEIPNLAKLCATQDVALVSDCGTPVFCDPGSMLIAECRKQKIATKPILGASSLMGLLSMSSQRIDQFLFRGFVPAETEARKKELATLQKEKRAIVIMDTPYRLQKTLQDLQEFFSKRKILICLNLSQADEQILEGSIQSIMSEIKHTKAEFMVLIYAEGKSV